MLEILETSALKAGELILNNFSKDFQISFKDDSSRYESLVTEVDMKSQQLIKENILTSLKQKGYAPEKIGFIGEESLNTNGEHLFVIDPIDGTTNFSYGIPYFAVSIAYIHNSITQAAYIYNPLNKTSYYARHGKGAYKKVNSKTTKLLVKPCELKDAIIAAHFNSSALNQLFNYYEYIVPNAAAIRAMGSLVLDLCYFADNTFHIVVNGGCFIWDIAAAKLIIEEAGGILTDWQANNIVLDYGNPKKRYSIYASHPSNRKLLSFLR